ncbi:hypothetical protein BGZ94_003215 [Podila epigama]|nr:hypothetical protein BGZ94_003215 [Podila epigama]
MSTADSSFRVAQALKNAELGPEHESTAEPEVPLTPEEREELSKPMVLISGAGIAGLMLAILLYKANYPFLIFERAKEVRPLGSFMGLGALIGPLFKQLGIYDEFVQLSKRVNHVQMYTENLKPIKSLDISHAKSMTGYDHYIISRPDLYALLVRQIPRNRILLGKRILSFSDKADGITIRCSDNSVYHGEILVGADGAYSAVRQNMYKELKVDGHLPACDDVELPFSCVCLVGQTLPLDPEEFPVLKQSDSESNSVLGRESYCTWLTFTTKQNTVCWMVIQYLNKDTVKDNDAFRNSEWGWEAAEALAKEVKEFKLPGLRNGKPLTLGDYVDKTPLECMSKVMLEEIVFETWYKGRAVLIGDACHKMNPSGGLGAVHAIQDAVALANWIRTLRSPTVKELGKVFQEYRAERYPLAKDAFATSQMMRRNFGKNISAAMTREFMKRMPFWMYKMISKKSCVWRYQVSFLPLEEDTGKLKPRYQASLHKTLKILKEQEGLTGPEIIARKPSELSKKSPKVAKK